MAEIIREGGSNPIIENSWQNCLKARILDAIYDVGGGADLNQIRHHVHSKMNYQAVQSKFAYVIAFVDFERMLAEMIRDGWVEVANYIVDCCLKVEHTPEKAISHGRRFRLTAAGRDRVQEHFFP